MLWSIWSCPQTHLIMPIEQGEPGVLEGQSESSSLVDFTLVTPQCDLSLKVL